MWRANLDAPAYCPNWTSHQLSGIRGGDVVNFIFSLIVGSSPLLAVLWRCQDTKSRLAIFNTEIKFCPLCILSDLIISVLIDIIYRHLLHIKYFKWVIVCASPTENGYIQVLAFSFFAGQSFLEILWIRFSSKCYSHTDLFIKKIIHALSLYCYLFIRVWVLLQMFCARTVLLQLAHRWLTHQTLSTWFHYAN